MASHGERPNFGCRFDTVTTVTTVTPGGLCTGGCDTACPGGWNMWEWGHHQRYDRYERYDRYNYERLEYLGHPARDRVVPRARAFLVAAKRRADFEGCHNRDVVGGVRHIWNRLLERWRFEGVTENEPLRLMDGEIRWSRVSRVVKMVTAVPVLTHLIEERVGATEVTEVAEVPVLTHLIE